MRLIDLDAKEPYLLDGRYAIGALSPHGRLIDADTLYEQTAEWEATALAQLERHMNDEDLTEWRKWSAILQERSAFKHDIADAPTIIEAEEGPQYG